MVAKIVSEIKKINMSVTTEEALFIQPLNGFSPKTSPRDKVTQLVDTLHSTQAEEFAKLAMERVRKERAQQEDHQHIHNTHWENQEHKENAHRIIENNFHWDELVAKEAAVILPEEHKAAIIEQMRTFNPEELTTFSTQLEERKLENLIHIHPLDLPLEPAQPLLATTADGRLDLGAVIQQFDFGESLQAVNQPATEKGLTEAEWKFLKLPLEPTIKQISVESLLLDLPLPKAQKGLTLQETALLEQPLDTGIQRLSIEELLANNFPNSRHATPDPSVPVMPSPQSSAPSETLPQTDTTLEDARAAEKKKLGFRQRFALAVATVAATALGLATTLGMSKPEAHITPDKHGDVPVTEIKPAPSAAKTVLGPNPSNPAHKLVTPAPLHPEAVPASQAQVDEVIRGMAEATNRPINLWYSIKSHEGERMDTVNAEGFSGPLQIDNAPQVDPKRGYDDDYVKAYIAAAIVKYNELGGSQYRDEELALVWNQGGAGFKALKDSDGLAKNVPGVGREHVYKNLHEDDKTNQVLADTMTGKEFIQYLRNYYTNEPNDVVVHEVIKRIELAQNKAKKPQHPPAILPMDVLPANATITSPPAPPTEAQLQPAPAPSPSISPSPQVTPLPSATPEAAASPSPSPTPSATPQAAETTSPGENHSEAIKRLQVAVGTLPENTAYQASSGDSFQKRLATAQGSARARGL